MPFVKAYTPGPSEKTYTAKIIPEVSNTPDSPIDASLKTLEDNQSAHLDILNEENGIIKKTQTAGGKKHSYRVLNSKIRINVIKSCCSSTAAMVAFKRFRNRGIKKRKVVIVNIKTNMKYKYSLSKDKLKREKM